MAADRSVCAVCNQSPQNPHTMLCGHIFCLTPCIVPMNSNQSFVQCPFCFIETHISDLEPGTPMLSSSPEASGGGPEYTESCPGPDASEHCPEKTEKISEVLDAIRTALKSLATGKCSIESLKASYCKIRDDSVSCKESLLAEVSSVDHQLYFPAFYSLERAKLFVVSTYDEERARLRKLQGTILRLKRKWSNLLQPASDPPKDTDPAFLKKFEHSAKQLLDGVKDVQQSMEMCEMSGLDNVTLAQDFESVQQELRTLTLITTDMEHFREQLALIPTEPRVSQPANQTSPAVNWDLDPYRVFVKPLPEAMKECDLHSYFSQFGLITEVIGPMEKKGTASVRCGFITFLETHSVRRVLEAQPLLLDENHLIARLARKKPVDENGALNPPVPAEDGANDERSHSEDEKTNEDASGLESYDPTIFVAHLAPEVTKSDLRIYFSRFGAISNVTIVEDWATGESRGYGFVAFADHRAFQRGVLKACHFLHGRRLVVQLTNNHVGAGRPQSQLDSLREKFANSNAVYVRDLPETTEDCDLHEYFSKFGPITDCFIVKHPWKRDPPREGFVIFRRADTAKKVLDTQPHLLNTAEVTVMPARERKSDGNMLPNKGIPSLIPNTMTISVRRLKKPTTEADLERYFSKFGDVANVKIVPDGNMGCCGHQGLVKFADKTAFKGGLLEICHFLNGSRVEVTPADIWITKRFGLLSTSN